MCVCARVFKTFLKWRRSLPIGNYPFIRIPGQGLGLGFSLCALAKPLPAPFAGGSADLFRDPGGPRTHPAGPGCPLCSDSLSKQCLGGQGSGLGFSFSALAKPTPAPCTTGGGRFTFLRSPHLKIRSRRPVRFNFLVKYGTRRPVRFNCLVKYGSRRRLKFNFLVKYGPRRRPKFNFLVKYVSLEGRQIHLGSQEVPQHPQRA